MVTLEICVEDVAGARCAAEAGADRVELCSALALGGLTPSAGALAGAVACGVPVVALLRPRAGDFVYGADELDTLADDLRRARDAGAAGVALGCLTPDGALDVAACARLVALAAPLPVTFHRAFDHLRAPLAALETLVELGCARVLTSGQAASAQAGAARLGELVRAARGRLEVIAAGGVRPGSVRAIVAASGVRAVHLSATVARASAQRFRNPEVRLAAGGAGGDELGVPVTDGALVRAMRAALEG
ncbi:MAG TPA: copper homeostasis protein CutC [Planctomycetota bacterium]